MELESNHSQSKKAYDTAKNAELIIGGAYTVILRKIKASYSFYNGFSLRKKDASESLLYTIIAKYLDDKNKSNFGTDEEYLISLRKHLEIPNDQENSEIYFLKMEWLKKIRAQLAVLPELNKDINPNSDEEIIDFNNEDQELLSL